VQHGQQDRNDNRNRHYRGQYDSANDRADYQAGYDQGYGEATGTVATDTGVTPTIATLTVPKMSLEPPRQSGAAGRLPGRCK